MKINWSYLETIENTVINPKGNLLFLHAFSGSYRNKNSLRNFFNDYNFFALNLPGHGNSQFMNQSEINYSYYCDLIVQYIQKNQLSDLILIGHSMGGGLAVMVNAIVPFAIKKLVLETPANSFALLNNDVNLQLIPDSYQAMVEIGNNLFYDPISFFKSPKNYERFLKAEYFDLKKRDYLKILLTKESLKQFALAIDQAINHLTQPTYLILGEFDKITPASLSEAYFKNLKNVKIEIIQNTKHVPVAEKSSELFKKINDFINN